jgi:hypothetical protein
MVVFGSRGEFLSHLPLYRAPHDWQMVLHVQLGADSAGADASRILAEDRARTGEALYTLDPETFPHSELASGARREFRATLYRGHFERGGVPIARGVDVRVDSVLYRRQLTASDPDGEPRALIARDAEEFFLLHRIGGSPDYDQIVRIGIPDAESSGMLGFGEIPAPTSEPLAPGQVLEIRVGTARIRATVLQQIYLEHGDLEAAP